MNSPEIGQQGNIFEQAILLNLTRGTWGNTRKIPKHLLVIDANKEMIGAHKKLLDCPELAAIGRLDSQFTAWLETRCSSAGVFKRGMYLLSLDLVQEAECKLLEYQEARADLVNAAAYAIFSSDWDNPMARAQQQLRSVWSALDYPADSNAFRAYFTLTWNYLEISAPTSLKTFSPKLYAKAEAQMKAEIESVTAEITVLLRKEFLDMVAHLQSCLSETTPSGKVKGFHKTAIGKIHEFVATFKARNLTNDVELAALVEQVAQMTKGVDTNMLKTSTNVRNEIKSEFTQITRALSKLITERPSRAIVFEDDEESEEAE